MFRLDSATPFWRSMTAPRSSTNAAATTPRRRRARCAGTIPRSASTGPSETRWYRCATAPHRRSRSTLATLPSGSEPPQPAQDAELEERQRRLPEVAKDPSRWRQAEAHDDEAAKAGTFPGAAPPIAGSVCGSTRSDITRRRRQGLNCEQQQGGKHCHVVLHM